AAFDPTVLDVAFNGVQVCRDGGVGAPRDDVDLSARDVSVVIDLKAGDAVATVWTNDLTTAYVHENSAYST
ncbi:MAG: bifunctional ornithine acetyltransferase/N-acetylglutamate synthase, partial [Actinomycetes bacterium]